MTDPDNKRNALERFLDSIERAWESIWAFLWKLLSTPIGALADVIDSVRQKFTLRQYGESLLTPRVELDLWAYTILLFLSGSFELFAWGSMWGHTGVHWMWMFVLAGSFAMMVVLLDRGILIMDMPRGAKRFVVIALRVGMLLLLACITAVPVELRVFAPEIDRVIEAAEKEKIDVIRAKAIAYETDLAAAQNAGSETAISGEPDAVATRRAQERKAVVEQQRADRAEITARQREAAAATQREITHGNPTAKRGRGAGKVTNDLRDQEKAIRQELRDFDAEARAQLVAFDAETERMRSGAVESGIATRAAATTALTERLHAVEVMDAESLAKAYGGDYKEPNGFLARYRILLQLVNAPDDNAGWLTRNQWIVFGCRIVMVAFGLCVLFVKFVMTSVETRAYFSIAAQAKSGNPDSLRVIRTMASGGDEEAIGALCSGGETETDEENLEVIRSLAYAGNAEAIKVVCTRAESGDNEDDCKVVRALAIRQHPEAIRTVHVRGRNPANEDDREILATLGIDPDEPVAHYTKEVREARGEVYKCRKALVDVLADYRVFVRGLCMERMPSQDGGSAKEAHPRHHINAEARREWRQKVEPAVIAVSDAEYACARVGGAKPPWPVEFTEEDPRVFTRRVWNVDEVADKELMEEYGWEIPSAPPALSIVSST